MRLTIEQLHVQAGRLQRVPLGRGRGRGRLRPGRARVRPRRGGVRVGGLRCHPGRRIRCCDLPLAIGGAVSRLGVLRDHLHSGARHLLPRWVLRRRNPDVDAGSGAGGLRRPAPDATNRSVLRLGARATDRPLLHRALPDRPSRRCARSRPRGGRRHIHPALRRRPGDT